MNRGILGILLLLSTLTASAQYGGIGSLADGSIT